MAKLIATIEEQAHRISATIDVKDMFFMVPLQEADEIVLLLPGKGCSSPLHVFIRDTATHRPSPTMQWHRSLPGLPLRRESRYTNILMIH